MKKGHAMMREISWEDNGKEIRGIFKVSQANASKLKQLVETGEFIIEFNGKKYRESPYAIYKVDGQIVTFSAIYSDVQFDTEVDKEIWAWNMMVADMETIGATV